MSTDVENAKQNTQGFSMISPKQKCKKKKEDSLVLASLKQLLHFTVMQGFFDCSFNIIRLIN